MQTISVPIDDQLASAISRIAQERGLSLENIVQEAVAAYADERELEIAMAEGERDIEEGRVISHEDFVKHLDAMQMRAQEEIARRARPA